MTQPEAHFESKEYNAAIKVIEVLRDHAHTAYLAGGCVRDLLLGEQPKDFDVATDAKPTEIEGYFKKTASVGAAFGVMLVRDFGETIEVATFRSDGVYSDVRRPDSIEFSSPAEDAKRRDFTINALFFDPFADDGEQVIDFVNGLQDVDAKVLRAVGDPNDRLREDHLRALRAVRFAAKYDLHIEEHTKQAIREHASELAGVSIERVGEELKRMLMHPSRVLACQLIDELDLDDAIFGDVFAFDASVMDSLPTDVAYPLALAALAIGRNRTSTDTICKQYRKALDLSNTDRDAMRSILDCLGRFETQWDDLGEAKRKRLASRSWASDALVILHALDGARAKAIKAEIEDLVGRFGGLAPEPMVDGADLIELGFAPGPVFKAILDAVYYEQLEGRVESKAQAVAFVQDQSADER